MNTPPLDQQPAFQSIVEAHQALVFNVCLRMLGEPGSGRTSASGRGQALDRSADSRTLLTEVEVVEILSGVNPTNQVIINPSDSLASGMTVRVAEGTFSMLDTGFLSVHDSEPV